MELIVKEMVNTWLNYIGQVLKIGTKIKITTNIFFYGPKDLSFQRFFFIQILILVLYTSFNLLKWK